MLPAGIIVGLSAAYGLARFSELLLYGIRVDSLVGLRYE
jgi:hypothetical protein